MICGAMNIFFQYTIRKTNYLTSKKKEEYQYFFLYQVIKGRIVKYLMDTFQGIDHLEFETTQFTFENQTFSMLTGIQHNGVGLVAESDDSVVIEQHVLKV